MRARPSATAAERLLQVAAAADHVAVDAHQRRAGKELLQRRLHALRALADRRELVAALRAGEGQCLFGAAVMAHEPGAGEVHGEPRVAGLAGRHPAAAGAEHRRRVAAPVQEHEHLAAVGEVALDGGHGRRRQPVARSVDAQVDDRDARLAGAPRALGQRQLRVTAGRRIRERLERGRRGAEHRRHAGALRAHQREVAAGVPESLLLLVGSVVLLVHDDQAERRHRREHGRARADHDRRAAGARRAPGLEPRAVGQRGMQRDDRRGEALAKARDELRRQRDLGDQHQRAAARRQHPLDEAQVDLRLAAAGDAVQQECGEAPERGADGRDRRALVRGQHRPRSSGARGRRRRTAREGFEPAARGQCAQCGGMSRGRDGGAAPRRPRRPARRAPAGGCRDARLPRWPARPAADRRQTISSRDAAAPSRSFFGRAPNSTSPSGWW